MVTEAAHPFGVTASGPVVGGAFLLCGWSFRETTGAAGATLDLRDGSPSGLVVATIGLAAGLSESVWLGERGLGAQAGLVAVLVSGTLTGSVWGIPGERTTDGMVTAAPEWWEQI